MRLIDADKLENEIVFNKLPHSVWELDAILTSIVSSQDTVEAIPIEWLEKYIWSADTHEEKETLRKMYISWEEENGRSE